VGPQAGGEEGSQGRPLRELQEPPGLLLLRGHASRMQGGQRGGQRGGSTFRVCGPCSNKGKPAHKRTGKAAKKREAATVWLCGKDGCKGCAAVRGGLDWRKGAHEPV
jgi:hypothetical protein